MKFKEYLTEDAATLSLIPILAQMLVFGSVMGTLAGSGGKSASPISFIKNLYRDWKVHRNLRKLSPEELKKLQDEINTVKDYLTPYQRSEVMNSAREIARKLKSDKREDREGIAKDLETIKKYIRIDKKLDETKIRKDFLTPKLIKDLERDFEEKVVWDKFIIVDGKMYGVVIFQIPSTNKGKNLFATVVKSEKDKDRKIGYILDIPKPTDVYTLAISKEDDYDKELKKAIKWGRDKLEFIRINGKY